MATDPQIVKKLSEDLDNLNNTIDDLSKIITNNINKSLADTSESIKDLVDGFEKGEDITKRLGDNIKKAQKENRTLGLDQNRLQAQLLEVEKKLATKYSAKLKIQKESIEQQIKDNLLQQNLNEEVIDYLNTLSQINRTEEDITEEKKKQNSLIDAANGKIKELKGKFTEMLTTVSIFDMIWKALMRANEISVDISKNFGYGAVKADIMVMEMQAMALASNQTNMTLKNMAEAMGQLGTTIGFYSEYSADTLETQIMLTKQLGLSGEEAAHIYEMSVLTGKSSSQVNDEMLGAFVNARNAARVGVSMKQAFAEAAKVSGQLQANFAANPAKITEAIVKVKALGTTLEQTNNQGEKLLNFSTSIESELQAELLTGKQLNLERARAAALTGDQVTLANELNKNVGTYEDFTKMNVLQQKALAEAVGLTADQLADQLKKQKLAQDSGKSLAEITKDEAEAAEKRKTIQEKYNNIVEKLQDTIGSIGTLLSPIIEAFTWLADRSWVIYTALGVMLLAKLPSLVKGFKDIGSSMVDTGKSIKENVLKVLGGKKEDKTKEIIEKTAGAGDKVGKRGPKAGDDIKNTLKGISAGIASFKKVSGGDILKLIGSAVALTLLTPAIPTLLLLQLVNGELIKQALTGIGKGLAAIGNALKSPQLLIGLAAFTGVMIGLGFALKLAAPAITAVGEAIGTIVVSIATGISTVVGAIGDMIVKIGEVGPSLLLLGPALFGIAGGLAAMGFSGILALPSILALTALGAVAPALSSIGIGGGEKSEEGKGTEMTELVAAVKEVKAAIDKLYSKDTSIYMDGKKVGTTLSQGSYKVV